MILFVSSSPRASDCVHAVEEATNHRTILSPDAVVASSLARSGEYPVVVMDEAGANDPAGDVDLIARNSGNALPVTVNSALMSPRRIADQVRSTLSRMESERAVAIREAMTLAHNEVRNEITALLMAADLALSVPGIPPGAETRLREIRKLATRMRRHFEVP